MICIIVLTPFPPTMKELEVLEPTEETLAFSFESPSIPVDNTAILLSMQDYNGKEDRFFQKNHHMLLAKFTEEVICFLFCTDITDKFLREENEYKKEI